MGVIPQGFTSGRGNGTAGDDYAVGELVLAGNTSWQGGWKEGTFGDGKVQYLLW